MSLKKRNVLIVVLALLVVLYFSYSLIMRILGNISMPDNQIIRKNENICVAFLKDPDFDDSVIINTFICSGNVDWKNIRQLSDWKTSGVKSLDELITLKCPQIEIVNNKNEETKILISEDKVCSSFGICSENPGSRHCGLGSKEYQVDKYGKIVDISVKNKQ